MNMDIKNDERPWGSFRQFTDNEATTVKILSVGAGHRLSLQLHRKRSEFWRVLSGHPSITIGETTIQAKQGDEFFVPAQTIHRIGAPDDSAEVLEIAFGDFDENDIVRLDDAYGRVS
ncbi:MAG: phosphomannose isomerase type II C-terminal cupin domain [Candidatus Moranbacteria bacterium]|nr:phosphomannose isomerase type II C-terminal cupin domain [Candidatus Moranbacteria bacterium]